MEMNRLTALDGNTAGDFDEPQAASNDHQIDNDGGFLENWNLDTNGLSSFQNANNGIFGGWGRGSLEDSEFEEQIMTEEAKLPPETVYHSGQAPNEPNTSDRGQLLGATGPITDIDWEHLPLSLSDQDVNELETTVPASEMPQPAYEHPGLSSNEVASTSPASSATVQADDSSSLEARQNTCVIVIDDEPPDQSLQKDVSNHSKDDTRKNHDGNNFIGSVSGLLGSMASSKAPSSGISRLRVPLDWTPPNFAKLPPKPRKRKRSIPSKPSLELLESRQTTKMTRSVDQEGSARMYTHTIQSHGSRNAGSASKNHEASRPRPAPIITTPTHTATSVKDVSRIACQLPTPESAASVKRPKDASQYSAFASPSASMGHRTQGSLRDSNGERATSGLTIHDVIVLSDDEEPVEKRRQKAYPSKGDTALSKSRQYTMSSKQNSQVTRHYRDRSQADSTNSKNGAAGISNAAVLNREVMSKSRMLTENASTANITTTQMPAANAVGRQQNMGSQQLQQPRLAARPSQQALPAITTHIGAKGTSKPLDFTGFQGSRPITKPAAPTTQLSARPMGKEAALLILQKTAPIVPNRLTSQPSQRSRQTRRPGTYRWEQEWHEIRDKQAMRDDIKSQKRKEKFRIDITSAHPDLPEDEIQKRVEALEKNKQLELFKRKEERAAKNAYKSRPGELEHDDSAGLSKEIEAIRTQTRLTMPLRGLGPARIVIAYKVIKTYPYISYEEAEERYVEEEQIFLEKERANDHAQAVFLNVNDPVLRQAGKGSQLKKLTMIFNEKRDGLFEAERVFSNEEKHSVIVDFYEMQVGHVQPSMHRGRKLSKQAKAAFKPVRFDVMAFFTIDRNARKCDTPNRPRTSSPLGEKEMSLLTTSQITYSERKVLSAIVSPLPKSLYRDYVADMEDQAAEEDDQEGEENSSLNLITTAEQENAHEIDDSDSESDDGVRNRTPNRGTATTKQSVTKTRDTPFKQPGDNLGCHFEEEELETEEEESIDDEEEDKGHCPDRSTENLTFYSDTVASFTTLRAANIEAYRVYLRLYSFISLNCCIHPTCTCRQGGLSDFLRENQINPVAEAARKGIDLSEPDCSYSFDNDPVYGLTLGFRHLQISVKKIETIGPLLVGEGLIDNTEELEEEEIERRAERREMLQRQQARKEAKKMQELERQASRMRQQEKALDHELTAAEITQQQAEQGQGESGDIATEEEQQRLLEQELQGMDNKDSDMSEEE
ncbi:hypothetical protein MCOR25_006004 [Pyricularia grisea]|uniref:Uncharacterized protein n=1 Tax=Pyricularia grisea TaxID=148305 RepID=A0A6P8BJG6_PYRGI|nr:uncharacterized protein PgNI_01316 [Pyricularia grisea]KAI6363163.1 hypothetical protein MCOR25_006004 [Pyricularia grisea]TLD16717.1 hypothetical protein PgNI_01316 [Pyricularia grisea]